MITKNKKIFITCLSLGLLIRLFLIPYFTSPYMTDFFIPFIDKGVTHPGLNPWSLSDIKLFPYGLISYLIFYIPKSLGYILFGDMALGQSFLSFALMKLPLIIFDYFIFYFLVKLFPHKKMNLVFLYWLNPVVIYISYVYSHLDIISVAFAFLAIYFLMFDHIKKSALFFGLACASKFYVFAILPLLLVYIWNTQFAKVALKNIFGFLVISGGLILIGLSPILMADKLGYATVTSPEALKILHLNLSLSDSVSLYLGLSIVLIALFRLVLSTKISKSGLLLGSYFIFGLLMWVSFPLINWYLWVMPGFIYFYLNYKSFHRVIFHAFQVTLIISVALSFLNYRFLDNLVFTVLQTLLFLMLVTLWVIALKFEMPLKRRIQPFLVGLAGDSGAGKNYTSESLNLLFGQKGTLMVEGDNYHRWQRGDEHWKAHTHLEPTANDLNSLLSHTQTLKSNQEVLSKHYDHSDGQFTLPQLTEPNRIMIFQGLHTFYMKEMRQKLDLKIFLNPDQNIRFFWKIQRDKIDRGADVKKVLETLKQREADSKKYISPQINYADWIIEIFTINNYTEQSAIDGIMPEISVRHILNNDDYDLQTVVQIINESLPNTASLKDFDSDLSKIVFEIKSAPDLKTIHKIVNQLNRPLRQITKSWTEPKWQSGFEGINQIIALLLLEKKGFNE